MPTLGGSGPGYLFTEVLGAPVVTLPLANFDNNQHAANENLRLGNLWDGIEMYAGLLVQAGEGVACEDRSVSGCRRPDVRVTRLPQILVDSGSSGTLTSLFVNPHRLSTHQDERQHPRQHDRPRR